jgi:archaellum component FlaG (FlaF/FlaG flagellin family)
MLVLVVVTRTLNREQGPSSSGQSNPTSETASTDVGHAITVGTNFQFSTDGATGTYTMYVTNNGSSVVTVSTPSNLRLAWSYRHRTRRTVLFHCHQAWGGR